MCEEIRSNIDDYGDFIAKTDQGFGSITCMFSDPDFNLVTWANETDYGFPIATADVGAALANFSKEVYEVSGRTQVKI